MSANEHIVRIEHDLTDEALERLAARAVELLAPRIERELFPQWLRAEDAAAHLGISRATLDRWAALGLIERFRHDQITIFNVRSIRGNTPALREVG
jgi:hypothetical protein